MTDISYIIPAYQPTQILFSVMQNLRELTPAPIIVINDGSSHDRADLFEKIEAHIPNVIIIHHNVNRGKGDALKTGFKYALSHFETLVGVVTLDADGQHRPKDALLVAQAMLNEKTAFVLGCRQFDKKHKIPLRSKFGNQITKYIFKSLTNSTLSDTQTGLRGIPLDLIKSIINISATGYEFEADMLLIAVKRRIAIREVKIKTIYLDGNATSHFNPIIDSIRIYYVLFRSIVTSMITDVVKQIHTTS